jgi:hypothetical protein
LVSSPGCDVTLNFCLPYVFWDCRKLGIGLVG